MISCRTISFNCFIGAILIIFVMYFSLERCINNFSLIPSIINSGSSFLPDDRIRMSISSNEKNKEVANSEPYTASNIKSSSENFGIIVSSDEYVISNIISHRHLTGPLKEKSVHSEGDVLIEEVLACLRKAKYFAESGKRKLAHKLYMHALALNPKYAKALIEYGEFLEEENIVQADILYQRALSYDPSHTTALQNRQRTAPVVQEHDNKMFANIDALKKDLYKHSAHHPTLRAAMKEFYYQHIYHTIALEGNTLSLKEIKLIVNDGTTIAKKSITEHNEVVGLVEALNYLNNTLLLKHENITVDDIKSIHKRVYGFVDPIAGGEFRTTQVFIARHVPPHPNDVEIYMDQLGEWLASEEVFDLHPVEFAAFAHYRLVYIHPFADGNGRTSRLLMNYILMKNGFPPVSIEVEDRWKYYECLIAANNGDLRPFVRFIASCTLQTLEDYLCVAELPYIPLYHQENGQRRCRTQYLFS